MPELTAVSSRSIKLGAAVGLLGSSGTGTGGTVLEMATLEVITLEDVSLEGFGEEPDAELIPANVETFRFLS